MKKFIWVLGLTAFFIGGKMLAQDIDLKLIIPQSTPEGKREVYLPRYQRIHVIMTNKSDKKIKLWKDWNSWGWDNLSLVWSAGGGKPQIIRRIRPGYVDGDFPDFWTLEVGSHWSWKSILGPVNGMGCPICTEKKYLPKYLPYTKTNPICCPPNSTFGQVRQNHKK